MKKTKTKVYLIDVDKTGKNVMGFSDEQFMDEAEEQGTVYSLVGFQNAFNGQAVNTSTDCIRILTV